LALNGLYEVISQEIELFITTAVRTSNPAGIHKIKPFNIIYDNVIMGTQLSATYTK
jgi:hypothetical protein